MRKQWTRKEEDILFKKISECSTKKTAFMAAARVLNRDVTACINHYYYLYSKGTSVKYAWEPKEIAVLLQCISKSPTNLQNAFTEASKVLNRTKEACSFKWYSEIRHTTDGKNALLLVSKYKVCRGGKNAAQSKRLLVSRWRFLLSFLGL